MVGIQYNDATERKQMYGAKVYIANLYPMKTMGTGNCVVMDHYYGVSPQFLQPFSIDSADFPCRDHTIPSPRSFHVVKICSVLKSPNLMKSLLVFCSVSVSVFFFMFLSSKGHLISDYLSQYFNDLNQIRTIIQATHCAITYTVDREREGERVLSGKHQFLHTSYYLLQRSNPPSS